MTVNALIHLPSAASASEEPSRPAPHPAATAARAVGAFFAAVGRGIGRAAVAVHGSVDPDARRDLAWMPVLAVASVAFGDHAPRALSDDGARPIVFVHGLAGLRGNFTPMRTWLRLHGRSRTYSIKLSAGTIPEMALELRRFIAEVIRVNELPASAQVDVVAHSMGGLVSRLALHDERTARRVHTLVTLGTPHGGTHAARFASGPLTDALRPHSELMRRLDTDLPWRRPIRLVCFWSAGDPLMQPAMTATVDGAESWEVAGFSHLDWLMRKAAWMGVDEVLRG